jgi:hypothetical protein
MRKGHPTCWVWQEQDRALVALTANGSITALNPGASLPSDEATLRRLATREAARFGVDAVDLPVATGAWAA